MLQTEATAAKQETVRTFSEAATAESNRLLCERGKYRRFNDFWRGEGMASKANTGFNIQVICDLARGAWKKQRGCTSVNGVTVKFNVPRNCKRFDTKGFPFVELGLYPRKRTAVPIRKNRNWDRFSGLLGSGWTCKTFGLAPTLEIVAYLSKPDAPLPTRKNVLGVDVNSKCFVATVLSPEGKVLKQLYLGRDIWERRRRIFERKSILRSQADGGSRSARRKLQMTRTKEHDFVKNRIGEVVRDITKLALRYDADIAIENLKRFSPKGKRFNRQVMRIPFYAFKRNLEQRCLDRGIALNTVDGWHTSRWCTRCGAVGKGHDEANYSLFRCNGCGLVVNSDRKASLAIAAKSLLERSANTHSVFQISGRRVPVSGLVGRPHEIDGRQAVPSSVDRGKPADLSHR